MKTYEYIRLVVDTSDLESLNRLGSTGWHVITILSEYSTQSGKDWKRIIDYYLLERCLNSE